MRRADALYVTADGLLQPLAYSQVVRVVSGLAGRGFRYAIASAERATDLADADRVAALRAELESAGVAWAPVTWTSGSGSSVGASLARLSAKAAELAVRHRPALIHARAYQGGAVALGLRAMVRVPYLFDARGYWIDERLDEGRWFTRPRLLSLARSVERAMYRRASAIVTLTQLQADDVSTGRFGPPRTDVILAIPTCADYAAFECPEPRVGPWQELERGRPGAPVIGIIGSINASYEVDASLALARRILERSARARICILSAQHDGYARLVGEWRPDQRARVTIDSALHRDMPQWLSRLDWVMSLLTTSPAKRASMPTKLAELFAAGVRPIHHGCNEEVTEWVRRAGSGYVLESLGDEALDAAAEHVVGREHSPSELSVARDRTRAHFDLRTGLDRYAAILESFGASS